MELKVHLSLMHIATNSEKIDLSLEKNTEKFAERFLKKLKPGFTIFLYGEMGVGKTTFIRYLINKLQKENKLKITEVPSPTFNILNEYQINNLIIKHYDLFRLKSVTETKNLDLFEDKSKTITLIEWPEIIEKKPINLIELIFTYEANHQKRSLQIKGLNL